MRAISRRLGIAGLSATLLASAFGTTQAGVIPWLYDAIFGPVYPSYGYGVYATNYSPCSTGSCGVPYAAANCGPCSVRTSYCGPCESAGLPCAPKTIWKSDKPTLAEPKKAEMKTEVRSNLNPPTETETSPTLPPRRTTPTFDPNDTELKKVVVPDDATPARPGFNATRPNAIEPDTGLETGKEPKTEGEFSEPKQVRPLKQELPFENNGNGQARRPLNLDDKPTYSVGATLSPRASQLARFRDARIARQVVEPKAEPTSTTSVVKK